MPDAPLAGVKVVSLAPNLPGPAAAMRLVEMGASVVKVEPPSGDFMATGSPSYYAELVAGQEIRVLDLKDPDGLARLFDLLAEADILLTSSRPQALAKLGLGWDALCEKFDQLIQVAIVGYPGDGANIPGHDLTYQAANGTLTPPALPRVLMADLAGAERAVSAALAGLFQRVRMHRGNYTEVALSQAAEFMAGPARHHLTGNNDVLGGAAPQYNLYPSADGWVALAALEPHFWQRLRAELNLPDDGAGLAEALAVKPSAHWEAWAKERDLPIAEVR